MVGPGGGGDPGPPAWTLATTCCEVVKLNGPGGTKEAVAVTWDPAGEAFTRALVIRSVPLKLPPLAGTSGTPENLIEFGPANCPRKTLVPRVRLWADGSFHSSSASV